MSAEPKNTVVPPPGGVKTLWILFWEFAKITTVVIGGGYVIMAAVEQVFVRRRRYLSQEEVIDMLVVAQTVPGIIACNGAIYVGYRIAGFAGAGAALLGTVAPPVIAILLIAHGLALLPDNAYVSGGFSGAIACIVGMLFATAWRLGRSIVKGAFELIVAAAVVVGMVVFGLNPAWLVLGAAPFGLAYVAWQQRRMRAAAAAAERGDSP